METICCKNNYFTEHKQKLYGDLFINIFRNIKYNIVSYIVQFVSTNFGKFK